MNIESFKLLQCLSYGDSVIKLHMSSSKRVQKNLFQVGVENDFVFGIMK
jgi:hypothetical protein